MSIIEPVLVEALFTRLVQTDYKHEIRAIEIKTANNISMKTSLGLLELIINDKACRIVIYAQQGRIRKQLLNKALLPKLAWIDECTLECLKLIYDLVSQGKTADSSVLGVAQPSKIPKKKLSRLSAEVIEKIEQEIDAAEKVAKMNGIKEIFH